MTIETQKPANPVRTVWTRGLLHLGQRLEDRLDALRRAAKGRLGRLDPVTILPFPGYGDDARHPRPPAHAFVRRTTGKGEATMRHVGSSRLRCVSNPQIGFWRPARPRFATPYRRYVTSLIGIAIPLLVSSLSVVLLNSACHYPASHAGTGESASGSASAMVSVSDRDPVLVRDATDFSDYFLADDSDLAQILRTGNLMGKATDADPDINPQGWFEYEFVVDEADWYAVVYHREPDVPDGWIASTDVLVDGRAFLNRNPERIGGDTFTAGSIWLEQGSHTVKLSRWIWTGMRPISKIELVPVAGGGLADRVRVSVADDVPLGRGNYMRTGSALPVHVHTAGDYTGTFTIELRRLSDDRLAARYPIRVDSAPEEITHTVSVQAPSTEGLYYLKYQANGAVVPTRTALIPLYIYAIDANPIHLTESNDEVGKTLLHTIDAVATFPDYTGGNDDRGYGSKTRVVDSSFGSYRETADWGFRQHKNETEPSFIAYVIPKTLSVGQLYLLEVDYPNDRQRSFSIALREAKEGMRYLATGANTGRHYPTSETFHTLSLFFWAKSSRPPRVMINNAHDHNRAAVKQIRLYRVDSMPAMERGIDERAFVHFDEEGNYQLQFGQSEKDAVAQVDVVDRWARYMRYIGANTFFPTVGIYSHVMIPSRTVDLEMSSMASDDLFRLFLLKAEKYDLSVIADFHRGRDLKWQQALTGHPHGAEALDRQGQTHEKLFNPVHPAVRDYARRWVEAFVNRYKDAPALKGVSIRSMSWRNPGMNNFHKGLEYGYDDFTAALFQSETGVADPGSPVRRHAKYTSPAHYDTWVTWRVNKIRELYEDLTAIVTSAREDLMMYSLVDGGLAPNDFDDREWAEAGLANYTLPGFAFINGVYQYGWKHGDTRRWDDNRKNLTERLGAFDTSRSFLFWAKYVEGGKKPYPRELVGLSPQGSFTSAHHVPTDRNNLEHYALSLARYDAVMVGNGGNTYWLDQPLIREFTAEYTHLPADRCRLVNGISDPVVVRDHLGDDYRFYAVNQTAQPRTVTLNFDSDGTVTRLSREEVLPTVGRRLTLRLRSFETAVFRGNGPRLTSAGQS